jgi:hypothetical protein
MVGDLVLRLKQDGHGKLESPCMGPYIITEVIPGGAYQLQEKKMGKDESNPWNAEQLRRFYASSDIRRQKSFSSSDPLNLEHEAISRVHWVKLTICVNVLLYTRGLRPSSHTK